MASLSDADLRKALQKHGYEAGPITTSTRPVYLKKLETLNNDANGATNSIKASKRITRASRTPPRKARIGNTYAEDRSDASSPAAVIGEAISNHLTILNNSDHASATRLRTSANYSPSRLPSKHRPPTAPSIPWVTPARPSLGRLPAPSFRGSDSSSLRDSNDTNFRIPKQPPVHQPPREDPQRSAGHTPTRRTYIYYDNTHSSDSDAEITPNRSGSLLNTVSRVTGWLRGSQNSDGSRETPHDRLSVGSRFSENRDDRFQVSDTDQSDIETKHLSTTQRIRNSLSRALSQRDTGTATSSSLLFTPPRLRDRRPTLRSSTSILSEDEIDLDNYGKYRSDQLKRDPNDMLDATSTTCTTRWISSFVAHIPNMILLFSILVVLILALMYMVLRDHHGEVGKLAALHNIVCGNSAITDSSNSFDIPGCLQQERLNDALPVLGILFDILSRYAGEYHCSASGLSSARMSINSARGLAERKWRSTATSAQPPAVTFDTLWKNVLFIILHMGKPHFNMIAYDSIGEELDGSKKSEDISELESTQPYYSGICRLHRLFLWMTEMCVSILWTALLVSVAIGMLLCIRWARNRHLMAMEQKSARIRDLVSEIVHLLQQQLRENESNPEQPPYVPVYVLRDRLRQKHIDAEKLWSDIKQHIHTVETCIGVREWRGLGETWQWHGGTGWQGSALVDKSQRSPFIVPPTECLKIRNMFSTDDLDHRIQRRIKRELLSKLNDSGPILHIGLDTVGNKGLVYVKCANADVAGRVYHAIHANYFDGRLLIVKFLRDNKYCLRFPEARDLREPLRLEDLE